MTDLRTAKAALRRQILAARHALPPAAVATASATLTARLLADPAWQAARTVGLFASQSDEPATAALHAAAIAAGKTVAYPRVTGATLAWHTVAALAELQPSTLGILAPPPTAPQLPLSALQFLLVPGVAFTAAGLRLGRGGGFYDRVLVSFAGATRSLAFACQQVADLPHGQLDQPVDRVYFA